MGMTIFGDYVSIAGTTAGVTGTISVPTGSRLLGLNISMIAGASGYKIKSIELIGTGFPQPLRFTPKTTFGFIATNDMALAVAPTPAIDLQKYNLVMKTMTVTVKVTTSGNQTVVVGLMWT